MSSDSCRFRHARLLKSSVLRTRDAFLLESPLPLATLRQVGFRLYDRSKIFSVAPGP